MASSPAPLTLVIGNKNYSSWSSRPWNYQETLLGTRAMRAWTDAALRETEFVPMDEPYASA